MNIAFMIGNGFDISLGLKTRYTDFYSDYFQKENNINNDIMKDVADNLELWSDLEKSLGYYTSKIKPNGEELNKFYEDKYKLDCELRTYLKKEQDKINWNDESNVNKVQKNFLSSLAGFYNNFSMVDKVDIHSVIANETCYYKLISFNYTNVIQKCAELSKSNYIETLYIHGTLEGNRTILGVNDVEQIENKELRENDEMQVAMCKLKINNFYGNGIQIRAEQMLQGCGIVCIFGMSLGETDKHWWNTVVKNLCNKYIKRVIIFHYEPKLNTDFNVMLLRTQNRIKEQLLGYSNISEDIKKSVMDKIKVICNMNIFNLNLIFEDDSEFEAMLKEKEVI